MIVVFGHIPTAERYEHLGSFEKIYKRAITLDEQIKELRAELETLDPGSVAYRYLSQVLDRLIAERNAIDKSFVVKYKGGPR